MPKLANRPTSNRGGPLQTTTPTATYEGGAGYSKDARTELFTLAVANFVSEDTFYESGKSRDDRFVRLVRQAAITDPSWTFDFIKWLRTEANMRTSAVIAAVEFAAASDVQGRQVIASTLTRADEPAEALAYVLATYGRPIPGRIKRGIADAAIRLYNERSALKWDSAGAGLRMGDVIDMTHPKPRDVKQAALFRYLLDRRHNRPDPRMDGLDGIAGYHAWLRSPGLDNMATLTTWEAASAQLKTDAAFWEKMIPKMGYMALLRNLRNFEQAGINDEAIATVNAKLVDPEEVAASRQFPYRFWSAYKHSGSLTFAAALEKAFDLSVRNIPRFDGRTLVLVDTSASMNDPLSAKSKLMRHEAAAVFGAAVAKASKGATIGIYASGLAIVEPKLSALRTAEKITSSVGVVGHGTETWPAAHQAWKTEGPYDRILIFTDGQSHSDPHGGAAVFPGGNPHVYVWDLAGYKPSTIEVGARRHLLGGLNDQSFKLVSMLESTGRAQWPWETAGR
jgi:hypothetical protein